MSNGHRLHRSKHLLSGSQHKRALRFAGLLLFRQQQARWPTYQPQGATLQRRKLWVIRAVAHPSLKGLWERRMLPLKGFCWGHAFTRTNA